MDLILIGIVEQANVKPPPTGESKPDDGIDSMNLSYINIFYYDKLIEKVTDVIHQVSNTEPESYIINNLVDKWPTLQRIVVTTQYESPVAEYYIANRHLFTSMQIRCDLIRNVTPRRRAFESSYMMLIADVLTNGTEIEGRNGSTKSLFGRHLICDLEDGFPILTVRSVPFRCIWEECMWILRGQTNSKILEEKKVSIWKHNTSREFLDSRGLTEYPVGEMGPAYGYQLRHFGKPFNLEGHHDLAYISINDKPIAPEADQWKYIIEELKTSPHSRRAIINLWAPHQLNEMALPPCAYSYQFQIDTQGRLNCILTQRSWDIILGWNPSTAALITHILAKLLGCRVGTLTCNLGDVHIYSTFVEQVKWEMCTRAIYAPPRLNIIGDLSEDPAEMKIEQFELLGYKAHPKIQFPLQ